MEGGWYERGIKSEREMRREHPLLLSYMFSEPNVVP
jgi:hypothetical protein